MPCFSLGLKVRLLYRTEATVPERFKNDSVELFQGDVLNVTSCQGLLEGVDGVCIILGTRNKLEPTTDLSQGTKNLIEAMKQLQIKRFSIVMSSFLFKKPEDVPRIFDNLNEEHKRMLELTKNSGMDYVAVLPPHIADEPATGYVVHHNAAAPERIVSKYDLAKFIVDCLDEPEHFGQVCGIARKS